MAKILNITLICVTNIFILLGAAGYFLDSSADYSNTIQNLAWLSTVRIICAWSIGITFASIFLVVNYFINNTFEDAIHVKRYFLITLLSSLSCAIIGSIYFF